MAVLRRQQIPSYTSFHIPWHALVPAPFISEQNLRADQKLFLHKETKQKMQRNALRPSFQTIFQVSLWFIYVSKT